MDGTIWVRLQEISLNNLVTAPFSWGSLRLLPDLRLLPETLRHMHSFLQRKLKNLHGEARVWGWSTPRPPPLIVQPKGGLPGEARSQILGAHIPGALRFARWPGRLGQGLGLELGRSSEFFSEDTEALRQRRSRARGDGLRKGRVFLGDPGWRMQEWKVGWQSRCGLKQTPASLRLFG